MKISCNACGNQKMIEKDQKWFCETCGNTQEKTELEVRIESAFAHLKMQDWKKVEEICEDALKIDKNCADAYLCKLLTEKKCPDFEDLEALLFPFDDSENFKAIMLLEDHTELKEALKKANDTIIEINSSFGENFSELKHKKSAGLISVLASIFFIVSGFLSSFSLLFAVNYSVPIIFALFSGIPPILLAIFLLKKKNTGITVAWFLMMVLSVLQYFCHVPWLFFCLIGFSVFFLLMLLNIFQKSLLKTKVFRVLIFLLPLGYALYGVLNISLNEFSGLSEISWFLGIIFYLVQLIKNNNANARR